MAIRLEVLKRFLVRLHVMVREKIGYKLVGRDESSRVVLNIMRRAS